MTAMVTKTTEICTILTLIMHARKWTKKSSTSLGWLWARNNTTKGNKDGHSTGGTSSSTWNSPPHFDPKIPDKVNTTSGGPTPSKILRRRDKNLKDKANSNKGEMNWASKFLSPLTPQLAKHQGMVSIGPIENQMECGSPLCVEVDQEQGTSPSPPSRKHLTYPSSVKEKKVIARGKSSDISHKHAATS